MKRVFATLLYLGCMHYGEAQTISEVIQAKELNFYGYDFSHCHMADVKREGMDSHAFVLQFTVFLREAETDKRLSKWFAKEKVFQELHAPANVNNQIKNSDFVSVVNIPIKTDSIYQMVKRYDISKRTGIGYVIIFECFDSYNKQGSAFGVFFDIETKNVISIDYVIHHDNKSFNRMRDWEPVMHNLVRMLSEKYRAKLLTRTQG